MASYNPNARRTFTPPHDAPLQGEAFEFWYVDEEVADALVSYDAYQEIAERLRKAPEETGDAG